jgi:hypothetical protein
MGLVNLIDKTYVANNKPFDFGRKAQYFTLDVISDVSYSEPFGFLDKDRDQYDYLAITERQLGALLTLSVYTWIFKLLSSPLLRSLMPSSKDLVGFGKLMAYTPPTSPTHTPLANAFPQYRKPKSQRALRPK